jgi:RNA polymerase sigma factor (sigma-70 family)
MIELSDERLALHGAQGDRRAFEAIYRRYHQDLYRFCLAMLGSPHDAQDTLQNTMVKVLRALPGEEREIKLKPWLYRIARNESIETLRRRRERVEPELEQAAPAAMQIAERAEDRERLRRLFTDLEQLPGRQRGALVMRELSGLSFEEIAKAFETTPATARQAVYEARLSLRQMEEGREMGCDAAMRALSEADGRSRRRRDLRAHLRHCASCRAFAAEIDERRAELAALAPLPLAAASGVLHGVLMSKASGALAGGGTAGGASGGGTLGGATAGGAGKVVASSAIAKSAATVAVAALVGVSAAGRAGLIDVPLAGHGGSGGSSGGPIAPAAHARASANDGAINGPPPRQATAQGRSTQSSAGVGSAKPSAHSTGASARQDGEAGVRVPANGRSSHRSPGPHGSEPSRGKPARAQRGLPGASSKGRQTAAGHKSPRGNPSPAGGPRSSQPAGSGAAAAPGNAKAPAGPAEESPAPPAEAGAARSPPVREAEATPGSLEQSASNDLQP